MPANEDLPEFASGGLLGGVRDERAFWSVVCADDCVVNPNDPTECIKNSHDHDHDIPATFAEHPEVAYLDLQMESWYGHVFTIND